MHVVEGRHQLDVAREQHPVAEHVARHVADAGDREVGRLDVPPQLAEVPLDCLPGAPRRDAHRLVVITVRASGGERVAEPEPVVGRDLIGDVGEGCGALVGGHDQVWIILVVSHDLRRRDAFARLDVVRQVEQAAQEGPVAGDPLLLHRFAVAVSGWALHHEPALRPHRHDQGVLDHLGLHQPKDLGAEVLRPVRPAQPSTRDLSSSEVDPFHPG